MLNSKNLMSAIAAITVLIAFFIFSGTGAKKHSPHEINQIILEHFKNPKHAQIELKIARIFQRIAEGDTNYDHLLHLYDLAESCRDALVPGLERDEALFTERLVFQDAKGLKNYLKYNAHFSGKVIDFSPESSENCGMNPNE